jgi:hypothetical protein
MIGPPEVLVRHLCQVLAQVCNETSRGGTIAWWVPGRGGHTFLHAAYACAGACLAGGVPRAGLFNIC